MVLEPCGSNLLKMSVLTQVLHLRRSKHCRRGVSTGKATVAVATICSATHCQ
jgi:hypothetical protein